MPDRSDWLLPFSVFSVLSRFELYARRRRNPARQRAIVALHQRARCLAKDRPGRGLHALARRSRHSGSVRLCPINVVGHRDATVFLRRLIGSQVWKASRWRREDWMRQIWHFSWPFSVWGVFTWAQQSSDRWALQVYASTADVEMSAVLFQLGYTPINLATGVVVHADYYTDDRVAPDARDVQPCTA